LLAINVELAEFQDASRWARLERIETIAKAGLDRTSPPNFELTDQLADRLAEAHEVLRKLVDMAPEGPEERDLVDSAAEALALPPDLEAMVERRIGH
jgi:hypothetical protein